MNPNEQEAAVLEAARAKVAKELYEKDEKKRINLERAAKIVAIQETEAYKALIDFIEDQKKRYEFKFPDAMVQPLRVDAEGKPFSFGCMEVDTVKVAYYSGAVEIITSILDGFKGMKTFIERAAEENVAKSKQ